MGLSFGRVEDVPEPVLSFAPQKKALKESSKLCKIVLELLSTLGTVGSLLPVLGLPVKASIMTYKEGLRWTYMFLTNQNGMIERLVDAKIERALATLTISQLSAKFSAIQERLERMERTDIPVDDRKLEVPSALNTCKEILELFRDENYPLWRSIIPSSQTLTAFVAIYADVMQKSAELIPNYQQQLTVNIAVLKDTLEKYKQSCVEERVDNVVLEARYFVRHGLSTRAYFFKFKASDVTLNEDEVREDRYTIRRRCSNGQACPVVYYHNGSEIGNPYILMDHWDSWELKNWRGGTSIRYHHILDLCNYCEQLKVVYEAHFEAVIENLNLIVLG